MTTTPAPAPRQRLAKHERHAQLLDTARQLIRDSGTDEFTLGRLAERAGVTKPLVYDHFGDRSGALSELYRAFEDRQRQTLDAALDDVQHDLDAVARVVAGAYIDCCLAEGREMGAIVAALAGSPALSRLRREAEDAYLARCRRALAPFVGPLDTATLRAVIGAGDALVLAVHTDAITPERARSALTTVILALATAHSTDTDTDTDTDKESA